MLFLVSNPLSLSGLGNHAGCIALRPHYCFAYCFGHYTGSKLPLLVITSEKTSVGHNHKYVVVGYIFLIYRYLDGTEWVGKSEIENKIVEQISDKQVHGI